MTSVGWSTQQLSEFAALLAPLGTERELLGMSVERSAEAFDAEIALIVSSHDAVASFGCLIGDGHAAAIVDSLDAGHSSLALHGIGLVQLSAAVLDEADPEQRSLVVCRAGNDSFTAEEKALLRGMARMVELSSRNVRLVASLRDRHRLLERLTSIQRAISTRVALPLVLEQILEGAHDLLHADSAVLWEIDPTDDRWLCLVRAHGLGAPLPGVTIRRHGSLAGRCLESDTGCVVRPADAPGERLAGIAAPVRDNGVVIGALEVRANRSGSYSPAEEDSLLALAEHATLAMNDARTVDAMFEAYHDHVTGLPNRALFFDRAEEAARSGGLDGRQTAVLFVDLDGFKQVNDTLGHEAGDVLLREVGSRLRAAVRTGDLVARFGGDEFAVMITCDESSETYLEVAERVLESIRRPMMIAGSRTQVGASIGIAAGAGSEKKVADLVRDADIAMYRAKLGGKDRFVVFEAGMRGSVKAHRELQDDLRQALDDNRLTLVYQPIFRLGDLRAIGVEAFARWDHPERGAIAPRDFVRLATEMNVVDVIDRWALREACTELQRRSEGGWVQSSFEVNVNVSPGRLRSDTIVDDVRVALEATGIAPARLVIEINENAIAEDPDGAARCLWRLHELGVRIALDNFGVGYSSLGLLHQLPIEILKIDARFVAASVQRGRGAAVAKAAVEVAHAFGMTSVGEGIESAHHLAELRRIGCRYGQGFLLGRPTQSGRTEARSLAQASGVGGPSDMAAIRGTHA